jgi:signal transduction histidine kinase
VLVFNLFFFARMASGTGQPGLVGQQLDDAKVAINNGRFFEADSLLRSIDSLLPEDSKSPELARFCLLRGKLYRITWQLDSAEASLKLCLRPGIALADTMKAAIHTELASLYSMQNHHDKALYQLKNALSCLGAADSLQYYALMGTMAVTYQYTGQMSSALETYLAVIDFFDRKNIRERLAIIENNLGTFYRQELKEPALASRHLHRARRINLKHGYAKSLAQNYHNLSLMHLDLNQIDSAFWYAKKSVSLRKKLGFNSGLAIAFNGLGELYRYSGQSDSAVYAYRESIRISEESGIDPGIYHGNLGLGKVCVAVGNNAEAAIYFNKALEVAQRMRSAELILEAYDELIGLYKLTAEFERALRFAELRESLNDSIRSLNQQKELEQVLNGARRSALLESFAETNEDRVNPGFASAWKYATFLLLLFIVSGSLVLFLRRKSFRKIDSPSHEDPGKMDQKRESIAFSERRWRAVAGNQMRSSLARLSTLMNVLSDEFEKGSAAHAEFREARTEAGVCLSQLTDLLNDRASGNGEPHLHLSDVNPVQLFEEMKRIFASSGKGSKYRIEWVVDYAKLITVDETMLRSIVVNLVTHAIKFSPEDGEVSVRLSSAEGGVNLTVEDEGGDRSAQINEELKSEQRVWAGAGIFAEKQPELALKLVRDLVDAHSGRILCKSSPRGGTAIDVYFPQ